MHRLLSIAQPKRDFELTLYKAIPMGQRESSIEELRLKNPQLFDMYDT